MDQGVRPNVPDLGRHRHRRPGLHGERTATLEHSAGRLTTAARAELLLAVTLTPAACAGPAPKRAETEPPHRPSPNSSLIDQPGAPKPGEWILPGRDYAGTRYSPLDQITAANAGNLQLAWSFSTITFAGTPWYPSYHSTAAWGLTPLEDQQLAGLVMWMPGGVAYLVAALALTARWLRDAEHRDRGRRVSVIEA